MMAFAMQKNMDSKMWIMQMHCNHLDSDTCKKACHYSDLKIKLPFSNSNFSKKVLKIKVSNFIAIIPISSYFLENKKLIKNISPPNLKRKIKFFSYSNLIKIIKSNT